MTASIFNLVNPELYVVTASYQGQYGGQIATWVTLAGLIPEQLRVIAVLSPRNFTFTLIEQSQRFVLNLLAEGQQDWLPLFGLHSMREMDKFAGIAIGTAASGIPILPDTCGWAECQVTQFVDLGDRIIAIADVLHQEVQGDRKPLCRREALQKLPPKVAEALAQKRLLDIEAERTLRLNV